MNKCIAFWDSSALIPLFVRQATSPLARGWLRSFEPVIWWGTPVEIHSAIARLYRSGELKEQDRHAALRRFAGMAKWRTVPPSNTILDQSRQLLDLYNLRAADSLQLAAALIWCKSKPARRLFLCAEIRLSEAAAEVGFAVLKP